MVMGALFLLDIRSSLSDASLAGNEPCLALKGALVGYQHQVISCPGRV
jgi:hypothetical protein